MPPAQGWPLAALCISSLVLEKGMKAWLLKDFGLDNLVFDEAPTPSPQAGELLVKGRRRLA
jgi:hypothetical protein